MTGFLVGTVICTVMFGLIVFLTSGSSKKNDQEHKTAH